MADALNIDAVRALATRVLAQEPGPVIRLRLLRDVLRRGSNDAELIRASEDASRSRWFAALAAEQRVDGSWGRFHSQDRAARQTIQTTEVGIERALALGLTREHPIVAKACDYIARVIRGEVTVPDRAERNDRWPTGVRMFAAATLARVDPNRPEVGEVWNEWSEVLRRTFADGAFDPAREAAAHRELHGVREVSYLQIRNRYAVGLLGSRSNRLSHEISRVFVEYLWRHPAGLAYVDVPMSSGPPTNRTWPVIAWLGAASLLSAFQGWRELAGDAMNRLWDARRKDGDGAEGWDFGPFPTNGPHAWLSEHPRRRGARAHDWAARVLPVLARYCESVERWTLRA